jgi:hypothetical protein
VWREGTAVKVQALLSGFRTSRDTYQSFDACPKRLEYDKAFEHLLSFSVPELVACFVVALRVYLGYDRARRGLQASPQGQEPTGGAYAHAAAQVNCLQPVCMKTR